MKKVKFRKRYTLIGLWRHKPEKEKRKLRAIINLSPNPLFGDLSTLQ